MTKYWFKPKTYGFGFYPVSWEGWLATLVLLGLALASGYVNMLFTEPGPTEREAIRFLLDLVILCSIATIFFARKTKEPIGWRWGR